jgi:hypothetical protein
MNELLFLLENTIQAGIFLPRVFVFVGRKITSFSQDCCCCAKGIDNHVHSDCDMELCAPLLLSSSSMSSSCWLGLCTPSLIMMP